VSQYKTLRILLAIVAMDDLHLHQLDVKTAFLNGTVEEELYMQQLPGYAGQGDQRVCCLHRALYGLKQASRSWHLELKVVNSYAVLDSKQLMKIRVCSC
jgi:hypothetical protein